MKTSTAIGITFGAIALVVAGLLFEAWLLGVILSWFGVNFTIWQTFAMVFLANLIFKSSVSSK